MSQDQLRDPNFAKKEIESAIMAWQTAHPLPQSVLLSEVTVVEDLVVIVTTPSIASSPSMRDLGKSALKRVVEIVASLLPESYGGTHSGESSGEGSSKKKHTEIPLLAPR